MSIEEQIEQCYIERDRAAAAADDFDGQENILSVVAGDVSIKPEDKAGKPTRIKRSFLKGKQGRLEAQSPQPAA